MWRTGLLIIAFALAPGAGSTTPREPALVATAKLDVGPHALSLPEKVGVLRAASQQTLAAEASGRIEFIAQAGQPVRAGEVVVALSDELERARLRRAEAQLERASAELDRAQSLHGSRATSRKLLEDSETAVASRGAERDIAREQLSRRRIRATLDGVVIDPVYEAGEVVSAGAAIATVMGLEVLELRVGVPGFQVGRVEPGAEVLLSVPALPGETFAASVARVAPAAAPGRHLFEVEIQVPNDDGRLRPGMSARARIITDRLPSALAVPLDLVVERDGQRVVFFARDGLAYAVPMADAKLQGEVLILPATLPFRELVVMGNRDLQDGQRLQVDPSVLAGRESP